MTTAKKNRNETHKKATPLLEWLLGLIGAALLTACVAFLVYEGITTQERPGAVTAALKDIVAANGTYVAKFELRNAGTQTLSNVHVTGRLFDGEQEVERVQTVIDYLPGRSFANAGFYFKHDPRDHRLEIRAEGYQAP